MPLDRDEREMLHKTVFSLMHDVKNSPKLTDKEKDYFVNELRYLEGEITKDDPSPKMIHNSIEDFEKSLPHLKDKFRVIRSNPSVREILKAIKKKRKLF